MKKFSRLVTEIKISDPTPMTQSEITSYIDRVRQQLPAEIIKLAYLTSKYDLGLRDQLEDIRNSSKSDLKKLSNKYFIDDTDIEELWSGLNYCYKKNSIRLLPQYQAVSEREAFQSGKLSADDITINLQTQQGKNAASKKYMPAIMAVVNAYTGKSNLDRSSLISSGLLGLSNAMNDWDPSRTNAVPFRTYAIYRAKQQILHDINNTGYTLSGTNWAAYQKYGSALLNVVNLDDLNTDKMGDLGELDKPETKAEETKWTELYKILEKTFSQRDLDIFYRYFGLNNRKREKLKDIASSLNMHPSGIINNVIKKIIKWLKSNRKAFDVLSDLRDIYTEALMYDIRNQSKESIIEQLSINDVYILLEEINKWKNKNVFMQSLNKALMLSGDQQGILDILRGDFNDIDDNYKKMKNEIMKFLSNMYPTTIFKNKTDVDILDHMIEIQNAYKKHGLYK